MVPWSPGAMPVMVRTGLQCRTAGSGAIRNAIRLFEGQYFALRRASDMPATMYRACKPRSTAVGHVPSLSC